METINTAISTALERLRSRLPDCDERPQSLTNLRLMQAFTAQSTYCFNAVLAKRQIYDTLYFALLMLYGSDDQGLTPATLSRQLKLTRTSAKRICDELIARGWAECQPSPTDRRSILLRLTPAGEAQVEDLAPYLARSRAFLWQDFSPAEIAQMLDFLERLLARTSAALADESLLQRIISEIDDASR